MLSFGLPVIIVGGLVIGVFTPTEASAFAAAYAIFLSCVVYRALSLRELYRVFGNAVQLTGELLLIVSLSFALGWGLSNAHVPEVLARGIDALVIVDSQFLRVLSLVLLAILAGHDPRSADPGAAADHPADSARLSDRSRPFRRAHGDRGGDRSGDAADGDRAGRSAGGLPTSTSCACSGRTGRSYGAWSRSCC